MAKKKVTVFQLVGLLPLVVEAATSIGLDVTTVTAPDSDGGTKVTPDEGLALEDKVHAALRPLAAAIVKLATKG